MMVEWLAKALRVLMTLVHDLGSSSGAVARDDAESHQAQVDDVTDAMFDEDGMDATGL